MDFYNKNNYIAEDIKYLIDNEVEENVHLDYKAAGALEKSDNKRKEITKDVSSFANSDGGIIVYGISEEDNKPKGLCPIDGRVYTKEWLESVIQQIQPRINNLVIYPIRINDLGQSVYVVKIPRSDAAPHMARDNKYYKRFNFMSVPMEDYEVKDTLYRIHKTQLQIINGSLQDDDVKENDTKVIFSFKAWIHNVGKSISKDYKLSASFFNLPQGTSCSYKPLEEKVSSMYVCEYCMKLTSPSKEPIFPGEIIEIGHYQFEIPIDKAIDAKKNVYMKLTLLYENGGKETLLTNIDENEEIMIYNEEEIANYIKEDHPNFNLIDIL